MSEVMKDKKIDEAQWKEIINECDEDHDGHLNFVEFKKMMNKMSKTVTPKQTEKLKLLSKEELAAGYIEDSDEQII
jgi:Spy/CpxP family protein refolding chaperone